MTTNPAIPPTTPDLERVGKAVMVASGCGLTIDGERVFCTAAGPQSQCDCLDVARAAIAALHARDWPPMRPMSEAPADERILVIWACTPIVMTKMETPRGTKWLDHANRAFAESDAIGFWPLPTSRTVGE